MAAQNSDLDEHYDIDIDNYCASETFPMQCSALRKGGFVVLKDKPCKIVEMRTSKTGKHGHAKVHFVGIDLFTKRRYEDICPSTHNMMVPNVIRKEYSLIEISDDDICSLLHKDKNESKQGMRLPVGELGEQIRIKFEDEEPVKVTVIKTMGEEAIVSFRIDNNFKRQF